MSKLKNTSLTNLTIFILAIGVSIVTGCGSTATETKNTVNKAVSAGGLGNSAPIENKLTEVKKTPQTEANEKTDDLPTFEKGEAYKTGVRAKLLKAGWTPFRSKEDGKENCVTESEVCEEFPELEAGPSSGVGAAIFRWKQGDKVLLVNAAGSEFGFVKSEFEQPKKVLNSPNVAGKYAYKSKHEYGEDVTTYDLKSNNTVVYTSIQEGEPGPGDGKGTWKWNEVEKNISVELTFEDGKKRSYVFELKDGNLKMTGEPKGDEGSVGFKGTIFKKQ
jgi:hypothetical protein